MTVNYPYHNENENFISRSQDGEIIIPVATHPRVVPHLDNVTALCDMQTSINMNDSILLAGLSDGRIIAISYRDVAVAGTLWQLGTSGKILDLSHHSMGKRGRLAAIQNNTLSILESHALIGTEEEINGIVLTGEEADDEGSMYCDETEEHPMQELPHFFLSQGPSDLIRMSLRRTSVVLVNLTLTHSIMQKETDNNFLSSEW
eukprot:CAMPEP_0194187618 /NCGR_PEP_ID=MMETSP0154-20130528/51630_1 /TAXON_ID=1049557 /ORGANISM="Thalassiothrix antarctica, Strain L6-D1" /LENGTH=202 /DNA_ID=CAMNT_0038907459 /DNA_START=279 /DNA_END=884 /DNA_ORIENTATION=-